MFRRPLLNVLLHCAAVIGGVLFRPDAVAASSDNPLSRVRTRVWTSEDGLPQDRIACVAQTRDGYLWIGTWFGLARFDGNRFTVFNHGNTPELESDTINALAVDASGLLWVGTKNGLVTYDGNHFKHYSTRDGLADRMIWQIESSRRGGVWLDSGATIMRSESAQFTRLWKCPEDESVQNLREDGDGNLLVFLRRSCLTVSPSGQLLRTNPILSAAFNWLGRGEINHRTGAIWFANFDGIWESAPNGEFKPIRPKSASKSKLLMIDSEDRIWATADDMLLCYDEGRWNSIAAPDGISGFICMIEDEQGNFWCGTDHGLLQLRFENARAFRKADGLPDENIWTVCQDDDGLVWAGTDTSLVSIRNNLVSTYGTNLPEIGPYSMVCPASEQGVWVATRDHGIFRFSERGIMEDWNPSVPESCDALFRDNSGKVWAGFGRGIAQLEAGKPVVILPGTETLRRVCSIAETRGALWIGTHDGGLARLRNGKLDFFGASNGIASAIWSIQADHDDCLWLGTDSGLLRFKDGNVFPFGKGNQMPEDTINCVLEDDQASLWLTTLHGIYRVSREALNRVADENSGPVQPLIVGTSDGLPTAESNGERQPAGWKSRDRRLWFPTGRGLVVIDPRDFSPRDVPPMPIIECVKADGKELSCDRRLPPSIPATAHHATEIRFTACDLAAPERVKFRTRLIGETETWSEPTGNRTVTYFNLRPGNYRFEVIAANHHGIWNTKPATLAFSVAPRFWETQPFYWVCATGFIVAAAGVRAYRRRWRRRLQRVEQQRALANERARIARDLHDDLGTALTGLALQLDVAAHDAKAQQRIAGQIEDAASHTRDLASRMREMVWTVNPQCDNVSSLASYLEQQATQMLRHTPLRVRLDFPEEIPPLPISVDARHQLALCVREALNNIVRHASATEVRLNLTIGGGMLRLLIEDDGCGFTPEIAKGNGLGNMRTRILHVGGRFACDSHPGKGARVSFELPLTPSNSSGNKA